MAVNRDRFELSVDQAQAIAGALRATPGVAGLSAGAFGEVSLLYPKQRVAGLKRLSPRDDRELEAHVVADVSAGIPLKELAEQARSAALAACPELTRLDIRISDAVDGPLEPVSTT